MRIQIIYIYISPYFLNRIILLYNYLIKFATTDVLIEAFLAALDLPQEIQLYQGFSFPKMISLCLEDFSLFLSLRLPLLAFIFCRLSFGVGLSKSFPVHQWRPPGGFAWVMKNRNIFSWSDKINNKSVFQECFSACFCFAKQFVFLLFLL